MKKNLITFILIAVMMLSLVACGAKSTDKTDQTKDTNKTETNEDTNKEDKTDEDSAGNNKKLTVAIWDTNQQTGLQEIIDEWAKETGHQAEIQVITWNEYWTLLEAGALGGALPDVFWMHSNQAQKYMDNDLLLDLTEKIAASDKIKLDDYYEDIVSLYNSNGKQYAVPKDIDTIGLWYNKTMFDEAKISYPDETWTWDTFYEVAKKLTKDDGSQYGYAINTGNNQDSYYNTIYAYGGYVLSDDNKTSGYDNPNTIKAMELFEKMIKEKIVPDLQTLSENGTEVLFQSGKAAMITQGSWMVPSFRDNEYTYANCDVAVLPQGPDGTRVSIYNGLGWAAAAKGENTDVAWSLIEYLGTKEAQLKQAELGVTMSAYKGTSENWRNAVSNFNLQAHIDMLDAKLIFRPYSRNTTVWEDMATEELKAAWIGEVTMEEACKKIAASMNETLAQE